MKTLEGKVAIVTGAAKGIGAAIATALAVAGTKVVVNYASSKEDAERVVGDITRLGGEAVAVQGDVSKVSDVKAIYEQTIKSYGSLDLLVNNAGRFIFEPIDSVSEESFQKQFSVNVLGTILMIRESIKHFGARGGSIINVGSIAGENPGENMVVYAATKGAINTITSAMSRELGARGIRVNSINPGHTETEGTDSAGGFVNDVGKLLVSGTPLGRIGKPADIAPLAVFLASDEAGWITGETIRASGGAKGIGY